MSVPWYRRQFRVYGADSLYEYPGNHGDGSYTRT